MAEATATQLYDQNTIIAAAKSRGEPGWLCERRAEAARAFAATPLPTPSLRPWRYTDVTTIAFNSFAPTESPLNIEGDIPQGAYASSLAGAFESHGDLLAKNFGALVPATEGKFIAANTAMCSNGVFVHAPAHSAFVKPLVITLDASKLVDAAVYPRLLIVAEEQAELTLVLRTHSNDAPLLSSGVIEIEAAQAARVRLLIDDRWGAATQDFMTIRARLGRAADLQVATLAIGGQILKQTVEITLEGEGASSAIRAVALGDTNQHFDFMTVQDHVGPRTISDVAIKAALAGNSRSIYYGITRVEENAAGAEANQENRNLLLSKNAKADSDPVLEILTADVVRCGHAATVGPVDQEALFYLQSRGLERRTALQLLVSGFFQSIAERTGVENIADDIEKTVFAKLAKAEL